MVHRHLQCKRPVRLYRPDPDAHPRHAGRQRSARSGCSSPRPGRGSRRYTCRCQSDSRQSDRHRYDGSELLDRVPGRYHPDNGVRSQLDRPGNGAKSDDRETGCQRGDRSLQCHRLYGRHRRCRRLVSLASPKVGAAGWTRRTVALMDEQLVQIEVERGANWHRFESRRMAQVRIGHLGAEITTARPIELAEATGSSRRHRG